VGSNGRNYSRQDAKTPRQDKESKIRNSETFDFPSPFFLASWRLGERYFPSLLPSAIPG
jgi:hypothetical protein